MGKGAPARLQNQGQAREGEQPRASTKPNPNPGPITAEKRSPHHRQPRWEGGVVTIYNPETTGTNCRS